jgi:hypothetical protein
MMRDIFNDSYISLLQETETNKSKIKMQTARQSKIMVQVKKPGCKITGSMQLRECDIAIQHNLSRKMYSVTSP